MCENHLAKIRLYVEHLNNIPPELRRSLPLYIIHALENLKGIVSTPEFEAAFHPEPEKDAIIAALVIRLKAKDNTIEQLKLQKQRLQDEVEWTTERMR